MPSIPAPSLSAAAAAKSAFSWLCGPTTEGRSPVPRRPAPLSGGSREECVLVVVWPYYGGQLPRLRQKLTPHEEALTLDQRLALADDERLGGEPPGYSPADWIGSA